MQKLVQACSVATVLLLVGIVWFGLSRSAQGQSPLTARSYAGRYQLIVVDANTQFVIDTQTGRIWYRYGVGVRAIWQEQSPDYTKPAKPAAVTKP